MNKKQKTAKVKKDLALILLSFLVGIILLKTGLVKHLLFQSLELEYIGVFFAGMLFTSVFTTVPATIALAELAMVTNIPALALIGGLGALCGDFLIFKFFKDTVLEDFEALISLKTKKRWAYIFKSKIFKVFLTLIGGVILASPLPDELGLALMGMSKTSNLYFAVISFACNSAGIAIIALTARALA